MAFEVHVGDVGTTWRVKCVDEGGPFDPSGAVVREIIFQMPQGVVVKPADAVQDGADWYLVYVAEAGFHSTAGKIKLQGHVKFGDNTEYRSAIQRLDDDGNELKVYPNIEVA